MFGAIRLIILLVIAIPVFIYGKAKKTITKKKWYTFSGILAMIILISFAFPVENKIMTFETPEDTFKYVMGNNNIIQVVDGEQSSFVIARKSDAFSCMIIPKAEDGWKIDYGFNTKMIEHKVVDNVSISVYQYKNLPEFYISMHNLNGGHMNISDNCGTEFIKIEKTNNNINQTFYSYYAYIPDYNGQYEITVDDTIITFNNKV